MTFNSNVNSHGIDLLEEENIFETHDVGKRLSGHVICSYLFNEEPLGDEDSLLTCFYNNVSPEGAKDAAWQLWQWGKNNENIREKWSKVRELWKWRLENIKKESDAHKNEFQWFLEWLDLLGKDTDLKVIKQLLLDTVPYVATEHRCWNTLEEYLSVFVRESPQISIQIYYRLLNHPDWPNYHDFDENTRIILETALEAGDDAREMAIEAAEILAETEPEYLSLIKECSIE